MQHPSIRKVLGYVCNPSSLRRERAAVSCCHASVMPADLESDDVFTTTLFMHFGVPCEVIALHQPVKTLKKDDVNVSRVLRNNIYII